MLAHLLSDTAARLAAVSDTPRLDAELLMAHALGVSREEMLLDFPRHSDESQSPFAPHINCDGSTIESSFRWNDDNIEERFQSLVTRRLAHEPVAYITGRKAFWTIELCVTPDVLIPRADSETLIEAALAWFKDRAPPHRILDLGTGSGALLLAALSEWSKAKALGVDASPAALAVAHNNADFLGLSERATFQLGDWGEGIDEQFDLILCNPPYVEVDAMLGANVRDYEPHNALFAGADGLDDYRRLAPQLPRLLGVNGVACLEIGHTQRAAVTGLARAAGLHATCRQDLGGRDRCLILSR